MVLPKCVRVDYRNMQSVEALKVDGWREIGICDHWNGNVEGKIRGAKPADSSSKHFFKDHVEKLNLSGRLWRDPKILTQVAVQETRQFIEGASAENMFVLDGGFGIFTRKGETLTLGLIGCLDRRSGVAQDIIRSAIYVFETNFFCAGTYSDNIAARRLYEVLGLELNYSERVFHK